MRFSGVASACHASMQGAWLTDTRHLDRLAYDEELVGILGLPLDKLPPLRPIGSIVGTVRHSVAAVLGLRDDVAVITGLPDLQAAALGTGAIATFATHLALSTTSWISCPSRRSTPTCCTRSRPSPASRTTGSSSSTTRTPARPRCRGCATCSRARVRP